MPNRGKDKAEVPEETVGRLTLYLRRLKELREEGREWASSAQLVEQLPGMRSANLRKDLSRLGDFGIRGKGYRVSRLMEELKEVLNVESKWEVALVGAGKLGAGLLNYSGFGELGFKLSLAFDKDPEVVGTQVGGVEVRDSSLLEKS